MRLIKVFILRLYTDVEQRELICGDLQALPSRKTYPFKNKVEMLDLVVRLALEEVNPFPITESQDKNGPDADGSEHTVE